MEGVSQNWELERWAAYWHSAANMSRMEERATFKPAMAEQKKKVEAIGGESGLGGGWIADHRRSKSWVWGGGSAINVLSDHDQ